ncbi:putative Late embryogenesis abundant (LEA) hydroxyproline-rich glycoprotein family [Tripterygium wilfordii]|uniref:Putative Late embryogenesis abundant (LEA) hydroxyproline-rich glycoprotein family n=1 Tax=Tripterygium wilfordii TaxID=458696 RepID=A0A7J7CZZ4_TRIWF|nr:NDR1/HIN1-like protein 10 [Tripterygium wilfordii]KAF5739685.1 putative Late embryogenesis abundant (LEA) hydroxyproline-rich glycoprotein family [Tripterygium wilfordii]
MADKQPHLNGAFYGPSIPPPRYNHRRGCGCCILSLFFKIMLALVVIAGIAILVFWLVVRPNKVKFHVTNARLTEFNLTSNNNLNYNLALNLTIRNPNKKIGVYYDVIEARALYEDQRLKSVYLPNFYQGHKSTNTISPVFQGQQAVFFGADETAEYNQETVNGVYSFDVNLYLRIRFKLGDFITGKFKPKVKCEFQVPLNSADGRLAGGVESSKCDVDIGRWI